MGPVVGLGAVPHGVADIEKAIDFYQNALGLELVSLVPERVGSQLGRNVYDAKRQALMNVGGAYYRIATFKIPNAAFRLQLFEMINNDPLAGLRGQRQSSALPTEGGGLMLQLPAADLAATSAKIRNQFAADVLTLGGNPIGSQVRRLSIRDGEDGFLIEYVQPPAQSSEPLSAKSHAFSAGIVLTAADAEKKLGFFRDVLGFTLKSGEWEKDPADMAAVGVTTGMIRRHLGVVPGTDVPFEIDEYQGFHQRRFYSPIMGQAGVGWIQLIVRDLDELMKTLIEQRIRIVSTGLEPVTFDDSRRVAIRDPDGVFIELIQPRGASSAKGR
jgi:catechol 2,3-dioxygenase-like lactoylglutathione lyase family enzyme